MTDTLGDGPPRDEAVVAAREWARRAVLEMVRDSGGALVTRPVIRSQPDLDMTVRDAEPVAGLRAARSLQLAAEGLAHGYIRQAREDGHAWHEIGAALGLAKSATDQETSLSQAAYDHAVGDLAPITPGVTGGRSRGPAPIAGI